MSLRILVVDDDEAVCESLEELLRREGCEVESISDPAGVVHALKRTTFHIVTLDLNMPKVGGMDLLGDIRAVDQNVAVIILTGFPSVETASRAINLDVSAYLQKPISGEELRETVHRIAKKMGLTLGGEEALHAHIARSIREARQRRGHTLKELGRRSGVSTSQLSQIETGVAQASVSSLYRIATALDLSVRDLIGDF